MCGTQSLLHFVTGLEIDCAAIGYADRDGICLAVAIIDEATQAQIARK